MTIQDMHFDFDLKFNKINSQQNRYLSVPEKDWLLNEAQIIFVKQRFGINNIFKQGFEHGTKRTVDLRELVVKSPPSLPLIPQAVLGDPYMFYAELSELEHKHFFIVRAEVKATKGNCVRNLSILEVQHDDWNDIMRNPFYSPSFEWEEVPAVFGTAPMSNDGRIYIATDGTFNLDEIYLDYIKYPTRLANPSNFLPFKQYYLPDGSTLISEDKHCELAEHTHIEIVDIAVSRAMSYIESPALEYGMTRLQTNE